MTRPPNMNAIMYFESVARHARVNIAAEELLVSPSAVSQQIKSLEEQMGVLLFRRVKRRLILTEEGERFYHSASEAMNLLRSARHRVSLKREHSKLIIRVAASFGALWLGPKISEYISQNAGVDLHIDATSELTDFEKENVDFEIRYGTDLSNGLHSKSLISDRVLPLCTPEMAKTAREVGAAKMLSTSRLIHTVKAAISWRAWLDSNDFMEIEDLGGLRFDRSSMALQAAKDGLGVVLESATLAMNELQSGALVPLSPERGTMDFSTYHLICPARHLNRREVKSFADWIEEKAILHEAEKSPLLASLGVTKHLPFEFR